MIAALFARAMSWKRERHERRTRAVALELLRVIESEGEEWIFDTARSSWETMAIERGWLERVPGYVRRRSDAPAPYRLTEAGREVLRGAP